MHFVKSVIWVGGSKEDLMAFPATARREAGFQLDKTQHGHDPDNWKPMQTIGPGVCEIRIRDAAGAFRVIYVTTFPDAVYVLHAFQKKTDKTSLNDLRLARQRFKMLTR